MTQLTKKYKPAPPAAKLLRSDILSFSVLMIISFLILLYFRREPIFSDDMSYFGYAFRALSNGLDSGSTNFSRLGFVFSVQLAQLLFGYSAFAYYLVPYFYSMGAIAVLYFLTRCFFPPTVAFCAALTLLTSPLFLESASLLLVDWPALFWFGLGLTLLVHALIDSDRWQSGLKLRVLLAVCSGLCFFLAAWTKEGMLPLYIPLIFVPLFFPASWKVYLIAALTFVFFLLIELAFNAAIFGDPWTRVNSVLGGHVRGSRGWVNSGLVESDLTFGDLALRYFLFLKGDYWTLLFSASLAAVIITIVFRLKWVAFFFMFAFAAWSFISLFPSSLEPLTPILRTKERYFSIVFFFLPPAIFGAIWSVSQAWQHRLKGVVVGQVVLFISAFALVYLGLTTNLSRAFFILNGGDGMTQSVQLARELRSSSNLPNRIVSDWRTLRALTMFLSEEEYEFVSMDYGVRSQFDFTDLSYFHPGDLVLFNYSRLRANERWGHLIPDFIYEPPQNWKHLGGARYRNMQIYLIPE